MHAVSPSPLPVLRRVLALETSTDRLSVAVGAGADQPVLREIQGPAGPQASATLLPLVCQVLAEVGWSLDSLDVLVVGQGPGSFTGVRTACSVAQGLAVAARPGGIPVLPVNSLLAVAESAVYQWRQAGRAPERVLALLDARMDEMYVAEIDLSQGWRVQGRPWLSRPEDLSVPGAEGQRPWLAGNAMAVYKDRLDPAWHTVPHCATWPQAASLLRLAPSLWAEGQAVEAAQLLPVYVRDKVALTTEERLQSRAQTPAGAA